MAEWLCQLGEQSRDYFAIWAGQNLMGMSAAGMGQLEEAHRWAEHALQTARSWGRVPNMATALGNLGLVALESGDPSAAAEDSLELIGLARKNPWGERAAVGVWVAAQVACEVGLSERAARLFGAVEAVQPRFYQLAELGSQSARWDVVAFRRRVERTRSILGDAAFNRTWADGRALSAEQALDLAEQTLLEIRGGGAGPLSSREREVSRLVAQGHSNRQIAEELVLSPRTVERHVENCLAKLNLASRTQLATWAVEHGLNGPGRPEPRPRR